MATGTVFKLMTVAVCGILALLASDVRAGAPEAITAKAANFQVSGTIPEGFEPRVNAGESVELKLILERGIRVRVHSEDENGAPLPGVYVRWMGAGGASGTTDDHGDAPSQRHAVAGTNWRYSFSDK